MCHCSKFGTSKRPAVQAHSSTESKQKYLGSIFQHHDSLDCNTRVTCLNYLNFFIRVSKRVSQFVV